MTFVDRCTRWPEAVPGGHVRRRLRVGCVLCVDCETWSAGCHHYRPGAAVHELHLDVDDGGVRHSACYDDALPPTTDNNRSWYLALQQHADHSGARLSNGV